MGQARFTLLNAILAITAFAFCFALFGVPVGGMFGTAALIVALRPFTSRWQTCELAMIVAWFLGATLEFSDLFAGLGLQIYVRTFGFAASVSWLLRLLDKGFAPHSEAGWHSLSLVPAVFLLAIVLAILVLALHMKHALSESAPRLTCGESTMVQGRFSRDKNTGLASSGWEISMSFGIPVGLGEDSSSTSERYHRMAKPVRLPTASEINVYDSLDEQYAVKHFLGKGLQQARLLFQENFLYYHEDLLWMGPNAFCFYVQAAIDYLLSPASMGDCFDLHCLCLIIDFRLDDEIGAAKPVIRQGIIKLLEQYDRYVCEDDVASRLEAMLTKL